jgi:GGDEF domain-containing protein
MGPAADGAVQGAITRYPHSIRPAASFAQAGDPVLVATDTKQRGGDNDGRPVDGMAVPVSLGEADGVLLVADSLPDTPTFNGEHLRLLQALANHVGVSLTKVHLVDKLRHLALHDPLTNLPNRRQFLDLVKDALASGAGTATVILMDLDRFKEVNDALGHDMGDELLREVGVRLRQQLAARGTVARLGGDEFAVLLPDISSRDEVLAMVENWLMRWSGPFRSVTYPCLRRRVSDWPSHPSTATTPRACCNGRMSRCTRPSATGPGCGSTSPQTTRTRPDASP